MALASAGLSAGWQGSRSAERACVAVVPAAHQADAAPRAAWPDALPRELVRGCAWGDAKVADRRIQAVWVSATPRADIAPTRSAWGVSQIADHALQIASGLPLLVAVETRRLAVWGRSQTADLVTHLPGSGGLVLVATHVARRAIWGLAEAADSRTYSPWGMGRVADSGTIVIVEPGNPNDPGEQLIIPVLELYFVINTVTLVRADTGEHIETKDLQVGIGRDGPHWTWSASIPGSARQLVARNPDPVELIASLNGTEIRLLVQGFQRDRRHGDDWIRVSGLSGSARLSDPISGVVTRYNTAPATTQQLAADVLSINGVPLGWALDWQLPDWLIPAGVWSHQGTHMAALQRLVEAGGGYLQAHPSAMSLAALPHYPVAPWGWSSATPDIVLPEDVVEVEGTDEIDKPAYNAVYVEGQGASGRRDRILRAGSAGDLLAPQIIDALATHVDMTRARGLAVLADTGPQSIITLRLPVLDGVGLILPGKLVEYVAEGTTRRGLTRSMSADWSFPDLWQTIEVETHG